MGVAWLRMVISSRVYRRSDADGSSRVCRRVSWGSQLRAYGGEGTQVFAEAEGADALLERGAVAALKATEERLELEGAGDVLLDFGELPGGEFFPARTDGRVVAEAAEENLDFCECEARVAGKADEEDTIKGVT